MRDDGGAAFPSLHEIGDIAYTKGGMTLRDYFAAKAMQAQWTDPNTADLNATAKMAYKMADAMIKARQSHDGGER